MGAALLGLVLAYIASHFCALVLALLVQSSQRFPWRLVAFTYSFLCIGLVLAGAFLDVYTPWPVQYVRPVLMALFPPYGLAYGIHSLVGAHALCVRVSACFPQSPLSVRKAVHMVVFLAMLLALLCPCDVKSVVCDAVVSPPLSIVGHWRILVGDHGVLCCSVAARKLASGALAVSANRPVPVSAW